MPFEIAGIKLSVDAAHVQEVLGALPWIPLPGAPPPMPGVIASRGRALAVLDAGLLFGAAPLAADEPRPRTLILKSGGAWFALPVSAAREVQEVARSSWRAPHAVRHRFVAAEVDLDGVVVPVVDVAALVAAALDAARGAA